ncbi:actin-like ATPase domain-containing protein [Penicillium crustosum]|uniref:actin-like ATPase domain-containing protein n=1 Tax=Penicillium crustosum TaxID=36656 RepID=UPI00239DA30B|nr:actin-like ATPase domain-containing protein [Penicillium crustosum]KAJ5412667.1 actin-like ATPase domain-containing protein [Penicillium crustosum]
MSSPCWGFGIESDMGAYSLTKRFLDSSAESTEFDDQVLRQTDSLGNPQQALHHNRNNPPRWMLWPTTYLMC